jgi:hypothetical protein
VLLCLDSKNGRGKLGALRLRLNDLAFAPQVNEFNGRGGVQLKVLDWRPAK